MKAIQWLLRGIGLVLGRMFALAFVLVMGAVFVGWLSSQYSLLQTSLPIFERYYQQARAAVQPWLPAAHAGEDADTEGDAYSRSHPDHAE